jgi:putative NADH-flavin reductase
VRLAIFGATGRTGRHLVVQALDRGHELRLLARRPGKVVVSDLRLSVVIGDVLEPAACHQVVDGAEAVVSTIGPGDTVRPTTVYSAGTTNVVRAMRAAGVPRLVCVSSTGPVMRADPGSRLLAKLILPAILRYPYADMRRMEDIVRDSGLEWVLVRATKLTEGRATGCFRVATGQTPRGGWRISRADLATFVLDQLTSDEYVQQSPAIAY